MEVIVEDTKLLTLKEATGMTTRVLPSHENPRGNRRHRVFRVCIIMTSYLSCSPKTSGQPWLPIHQEFSVVNVPTMAAQPRSSTLHFSRTECALRREYIQGVVFGCMGIVRHSMSSANDLKRSIVILNMWMEQQRLA